MLHQRFASPHSRRFSSTVFKCYYCCFIFFLWRRTDAVYQRTVALQYVNKFRNYCFPPPVIQVFFLYFFLYFFLSFGATASRFLEDTQRRTTLGRTLLYEWSARRRDLYLTTHNTHNSQPSMTPVRFEPTILAGQRPQTYAFDRAATGTGNSVL